MSAELVWELVKNSNSFLRKSVHGAVFSAEPGNLFNKHSYKYSGLANRSNTLDVSATADDAVVVAKSSKKSKAGRMVGSVVKKNARRTNFAAGAEAAGTRPDLKSAAMARAAALHKGIRTKKAKAAAAAASQ